MFYGVLPYISEHSDGLSATVVRHPVDPKSEEAEAQTKFTRRLDQDEPLKQKLAHTMKLSDVKASDYDAVFYPGGHGPLWDLAQDAESIALIEAFQQQ